MTTIPGLQMYRTDSTRCGIGRSSRGATRHPPLFSGDSIVPAGTETSASMTNSRFGSHGQLSNCRHENNEDYS